MKLTVKIIPLTNDNQCILTIRRDTDTFLNSVQLQFPKDIAEYIKTLIEKDDPKQQQHPRYCSCILCLH